MEYPTLDISNLPIIQKIDIIPNNVAFILKNVMTQKQCQDIIKTFENTDYKHVEELGWNKNHRNAYKLNTISQNLADFLQKRITPFLEQSIIFNNTTKQIGIRDDLPTYGNWKYHSFDNVQRINKYIPGGFYNPHYDGERIIKETDLRSFKTCIVYLNSEMTGGTTDFLNDNGTQILHSIKPETGSVLIFNHHIWHTGTELLSGYKYMIQTMIFYERTELHVFDSNTNKAIETLQKAMDAEDSGDSMEAMKWYRLAYKLCPELDK